CPTDFSDFSAAAVSYGAALAKAYGGTVRLLHVATPFPVVAPYLDAPGDPRVFEAQQTLIDRGLTAEAARVTASGVAVTVECRAGSAVHEILEAAEAEQASVIVLGTHGRGGFERLVLGSVTEKLLRLARCAVLTVPRAAVGVATGAVRWDRILCAHDGSAGSRVGVAYAASLAERTGAHLTLVSVVETVPYGGDFTGPDFAAFRDSRQQHAEEVLDAALPEEVRSRCQVEDRIVYGKPSQQLLAVAQQVRPDVIVMGVQGRGALDLLMFGSTTNEVVRQAEAPVLTVRLPRTGD
ncbi:MAG TPA: universal stress protein, partial [Vicinamibacterales bacterium]|nr:universal stress protein [Vicinamibacterales bacterium]